MGKGKRFTEEELIENIKKKCEILNYEFLNIIGDFKGNVTRLNIRCKRDEYNWNVSYNKLIQSVRCPMCSNHIYHSEEQIIENIKKECLTRNYEFIEIVGEFNGSRTKLSLRCVEHDFIWVVDYHHFMGKRKTDCPIRGKLKISNALKMNEQQLLDNIKIECEKRGDVEFIEIVKFNGNKTILKLRCKIDNNIWNILYYNFVNGHNSCPKCGRKKTIDAKRLKEEDLIENIKIECEKRGDVEFIEIVKFDGSRSKLKMRCKIDNNVWVLSYQKFIYATSCCPKCNSSKMEKIWSNILVENKIEFRAQHSFDELKRQSLDFYLPDYNIAIECHGEQHFIPVKHFGGELKYKYILERDVRKYNICKEQGIRILYYTECSADIIPDTYHDKIFTNELELLREILENNNKID